MAKDRYRLVDENGNELFDENGRSFEFEHQGIIKLYVDNKVMRSMTFNTITRQKELFELWDKEFAHVKKKKEIVVSYI